MLSYAFCVVLNNESNSADFAFSNVNKFASSLFNEEYITCLNSSASTMWASIPKLDNPSIILVALVVSSYWAIFFTSSGVNLFIIPDSDK